MTAARARSIREPCVDSPDESDHGEERRAASIYEHELVEIEQHATCVG